MARARNIKPGLFSNEVIAELPPFDRLLFIGLWCLADREGRLEDRPKRIKIELFPCDTYDVAEGLANLIAHGFIQRYEVAGQSIIEIPAFQKHQRPHGTEKDSTLPDRDGFLSVNDRKKNGVVTGTKRLVHVNSPQNNVNQPLDNSEHPLDNALIPDSLIPEEHNTLRAEPEVSADPKSPTEMTLDWVPDQKLLKAYAMRMAMPVGAFTNEATAAFVCHYSASGRIETQAAWVSLLVKWVKRDTASTNNVHQLPVRRQSAEPDFESNAWAQNLVVNP